MFQYCIPRRRDDNFPSRTSLFSRPSGRQMTFISLNSLALVSMSRFSGFDLISFALSLFGFREAMTLKFFKSLALLAKFKIRRILKKSSLLLLNMKKIEKSPSSMLLTTLNSKFRSPFFSLLRICFLVLSSGSPLSPNMSQLATFRSLILSETLSGNWKLAILNSSR